MARDLWKSRQLPPSWVDERTPHELVFLFCKPPDNSEEADPVAELHRVNHVTRASLSPIVPDWLMPKVPRDGIL